MAVAVSAYLRQEPKSLNVIRRTLECVDFKRRG
jgi:hypothetical protein